MRFVATADWQLGKQALFLPEEARARYAQARLDAVAALGSVAEEVSADFIVVGGDVFESNQLDRAIVSRALEVLRQFKVPTYLLPGNHDPLDAASIYDSVQFVDFCPPHVHVLRDSGLAASVSCADGTTAEIYAAPWFSRDPREDLVARVIHDLPAPGNEVRILAGHGNVSTLQADQDSLDVIDVANLRACLSAGTLDFVVLGDRHGLLEVADRVWYPGTPEVTAEREIDPGNVLVVNIDPKTREYRVDTQRVGAWDFRVVAAELANDDDITDLLATLDKVEQKTKTSIKLALSGTLTVSQNARLEKELDIRADLFARLDHWARHTDLVVMAADADFSALPLSGFALDALDELRDKARDAADSDERRAASDAVGLLYRLAGGGQ